MSKNTILKRAGISIVITLVLCFFIARYINDSFTKKQDNIKLAVVNEDNGQGDVNLGRAFISNLEYDDSIQLLITNRSDLNEGLDKGTYDIGIIIPYSFTSNSADINSLNQRSEIMYRYKSDAGIYETKEYDNQVSSLDGSFNSNLSGVFLRNISKDVTGAQKQTVKNNKTSTKISKEVSENNKLLKEDAKNTKSLESNLKKTHDYAKAMIELSKSISDNSKELNKKSGEINNLAKVIYDQSVAIEKDVNTFKAVLANQNKQFKKDTVIFNEVDTNSKSFNEKYASNNGSAIRDINEIIVDYGGNSEKEGKFKTAGLLIGKGNEFKPGIFSKVLFKTKKEMYEAVKKDVFNDGIYKYVVNPNGEKTLTNDTVKLNLYRINKVCKKVSSISAEKICTNNDVVNAVKPSSASEPFLGGITNESDAKSYLLDVVGIAYEDLNVENVNDILIKKHGDSADSEETINNKFEADLSSSLEKNFLKESDVDNVLGILNKSKEAAEGILSDLGTYKTAVVDNNVASASILGKLNTNLDKSKTILFGKDNKGGYKSNFEDNSKTQDDINKNKSKETGDIKDIKAQESELLASLVDTAKSANASNKGATANEKSVRTENKQLSALLKGFNSNIKGNSTASLKYNKYIKTEQKFVKDFKKVLKNSRNGNSYNEQFFNNAKSPITFNTDDVTKNDGLVYPTIMVILISFASLACVALNKNYEGKLKQGMMETVENFERRKRRLRLKHLGIVTLIQSIIVTIVSYNLFKSDTSNILLWFLIITISSAFLVLLIDTIVLKFNKVGLIVLGIVTIFYLIANDLVILTSQNSITNYIASITPYGFIENVLRQTLFFDNAGFSLLLLGGALVLIVVLYFISIYMKAPGKLSHE